MEPKNINEVIKILSSINPDKTFNSDRIFERNLRQNLRLKNEFITEVLYIYDKTLNLLKNLQRRKVEEIKNEKETKELYKVTHHLQKLIETPGNNHFHLSQVKVKELHQNIRNAEHDLNPINQLASIESKIHNDIQTIEIKIDNLKLEAQNLKSTLEKEKEDIKKLRSKLEDNVQEIKDQKIALDETWNKMKFEREETKKDLEKIQTLVQKQQASASGDIFQEKAKENTKDAKTWMCYMFISFFITVIITIVLLFGGNIANIEIGKFKLLFQKQDSFANFWDFISNSFFVPKLLLLSFGAYLTAFFARLYNTEKHLFETNTHRQNALNAHTKMLSLIQETESSDSDKETKNLILSFMSKAIFEGQPTGYLKGQNNHPSPIAQILETTKIIRKD